MIGTGRQRSIINIMVCDGNNPSHSSSSANLKKYHPIDYFLLRLIDKPQEMVKSNAMRLYQLTGKRIPLHSILLPFRFGKSDDNTLSF